MVTSVVSKRGWVVIPKAMRERYHMAVGSHVAFIEQGGAILLLPVPEDPISAGFGLLRDVGDGSSWTTTLLAERAADRLREDTVG